MAKQITFRSTLKQIFPLRCDVLPIESMPPLHLEPPIGGRVPTLSPPEVEPTVNLVLRGGETQNMGIGLLLDIPGLHQFGTSIFLKNPTKVDATSTLVAPYQKDLAPIFARDWSLPVVEDALELLFRGHGGSISVPEQIAIITNDNVQMPDTVFIAFESASIGEAQYAYEDDLITFPETENIVLFAPEIESIDFFENFLGEKPDVLNMFKMLTKAWVAGKDYDNSKKASQIEPEPVEMPPKPEDMEKCIHGLYKAYCDICANREEPFDVPSSSGGQSRKSRKSKRRRYRSAGKKPPVIDPFDLLLPFLYPPLDSNFENRIILPPGKKLFNYQKEGIKFLGTHKSALLADEMGLGKSIQAIFALRLLIRAQKKTTPVIIVSPKSVVKDWEMKLREWAPELRVITVSGGATYRQALWNVPAYVYIVGYDSLVRDMEVVSQKYFSVVILDEIQNIKNPSSKRSKTVKKLNTRQRWGLSATPLENKLEDLISIFSFLKPGLLDGIDKQNQYRIQQKIAPYFLRRRIKEVRGEINLGDKIEQMVWLELTENQRKSYEQELNSVREELRPLAEEWNRTRQPTAQQKISTRGHVLARLSKLKQICNFDPVTGESCKVDFLIEKLYDIIDNDEKVLIFSQYPKKSLQPLKLKLEQFKPDVFDGSLSQKARDERVRTFQETNSTNVLLMSVKAGGVGITLTRANHVYFLDQWWNPAVNMQATGRAFRIGQDKTVYVTAFCVADTVEERIREILLRKQALFDEVIDEQSKTVIEKISIEELFDIFDLVKYDVILEYPGKYTGHTIRLVSDVLGIGYEQARKKLGTVPMVLKKGVSRKEAERIQQLFANQSDAHVKIISSVAK